MARGLAARKVGDSFLDHDDNEWQLSDLQCLSTFSFQSLDDDIEKFKKENGITELHCLNTPKKSHKSAVYFSFIRHEREVRYLRFFNGFNKVGLPFNWGGKQLKDATGFRYHTLGTQSEHFPIKPSQVIPTEDCYASDEVINLLETSVNLPKDFKLGVVDLLNNVKDEKDDYVEGMAKYRSTIEKYIGEYAAPIHLSNQMDGYDSIKFPLSGNYALVDSFVVSGDDHLGVSSKGGSSGAAASINNISNIFKSSIDVDHPIRKKASEVIDTINVISDNNSIDGPLSAAVNLNLITDDDVNFIVHHINTNEIATSVPSRLKKAMEKIQPNLSHRDYNLGFHLLSGIARCVCDELNSHPESTNVFKTALKECNFVQVHAYTQVKGSDLRFSKFDIVNPYEFDGEIKFSAQKPYMATTKPKGKITFKIERNKP